ncbi:bifunctional hydroxymethylpyrimidine kinase/phosphomethylpyrimidine kinase [Undibacterium flavidum]|uniref:hydroxymethylpyrimidine kinase n=1 Tax=Undibacterium flavidum TaxID=2762297 RepID=A0ABR6YBP2_9BURK|nr:hydroxymethylpyrimidine/phosphomethylpyrimidine kinase [Undibacterium flavidum]MBC3873960.1 hydroxymethylpyrimidine/phosphomethylpyrimidine kinase [Undibacterium flavidum]
MTARITRPCVLVFAGHDPSGGAGIQADIEAITAQGAHALTIITALTVQDNNQVRAVYPVDTHILRDQFETLLAQVPIAAVKVGIVGSLENAECIAECVARLRVLSPRLPVAVDTVLGSGRGNALAIHDAVQAVQPVLACASLLTPNLPELGRLTEHFSEQLSEHMTENGQSAPNATDELRARYLAEKFACDVLLKGGHGSGSEVHNRWIAWDAETRSVHATQSWSWLRQEGEFHGSGCTLAAAIAAQLALGHAPETSLINAQAYVQACLESAYQIAPGQFIPSRFEHKDKR